MRLKTLIFLLFLASSSLINAQNYSLLPAGDTLYTKEAQGDPYEYGTKDYITGMYADSTRSANNETIQFLPHVMVFQSPKRRKCTHLAYGFLGPTIRRDSAGSQFVRHKSGQELMVYNRDTSLKSWKMIALATDKNVWAAKIQDTLVQVLGFQDTVYRLQLSLRNDSGTVLFDSINFEQVWIGKHLGVIKAVNFYDFWFSNDSAAVFYYPSNIVGQSAFGGVARMTMGQLHDYQKGDEVHWSYTSTLISSSPWYGFTNRTYLGKRDSLSGWVYDYRYIHSSRVNTGTGAMYRNSDGIDQLYIADTNALVDTLVPGVAYTDPWGINSYELSRMHYNRDGYLVLTRTNPYDRFSTLDTCYDNTSLGQFMDTWIAGVGKGENGGSSEAYLSFPIVYYKKGSVEWGEPLTVEVAEDNSAEVIAYPNPTDSKITIQSQQPAVVKLYDLQGHLIEQVETNTQNKVDIDLSFLENGTYLLRLETKQDSQMIKVQKITAQ